MLMSIWSMQLSRVVHFCVFVLSLSPSFTPWLLFFLLPHFPCQSEGDLRIRSNLECCVCFSQRAKINSSSSFTNTTTTTTYFSQSFRTKVQSGNEGGGPEGITLLLFHQHFNPLIHSNMNATVGIGAFVKDTNIGLSAFFYRKGCLGLEHFDSFPGSFDNFFVFQIKKWNIFDWIIRMEKITVAQTLKSRV